MEISNELKERLKDLGLAISSALSDSGQIAEAIAAIKESGYDVFLVLEATIGLGRRDAETSAVLSEGTVKSAGGEIHLDMTASDKQFLRALKIKIDEVTPTEWPDSQEK